LAIGISAHNSGIEPRGERIHNSAMELGLTSYVFQFATEGSRAETLNRIRNKMHWTRDNGRALSIAKYLRIANVSKSVHRFGLESYVADMS
jgi:hypothetical protein